MSSPRTFDTTPFPPTKGDAWSRFDGLLRVAWQSAVDGLRLTDREGTVLLANPAYCRMIGKPAEDVIGRSLTEAYAPNRRAEILQKYREQFETGVVRPLFASQVILWDGRRRQFEVGAAFLDGGGEEPLLVGNLRDVTDRQRTQEMLGLQMRALEAVAADAPLDEILATITRGVENHSDGLCSVLLVTDDGQRLTHAIGPSLPQEYMRAIDGAVIGPCGGSCGTAAFTKSTVIVTDIAADPLWADYKHLALKHGLRACWSTPVVDRNGRVRATFAIYYREPRSPSVDERYFVEVATHLTALAVERQQAETERREREALLRTVLAHIPAGVFWKDRNSIYLGCNDRLARDGGMASPEAVVGKTDRDLGFSPAEAEFYRHCDRTVIESGEPMLNVEETLSRADGSKSVLLTSKVPLRNTAGDVVGVVGVYQDVTDVKSLEEQYRQAQKMEAIGRLAGGIAHDFNNLLTVINGYSNLLHESLPATDPNRKLIAEILKAGQGSADLTRQLLAFSRRQVVAPKVLDINDVVRNIEAILRRVIGEDVRLVTRLAPDLAKVRVDPGQIEQLLMNLAVNARDAMPTGGTLTVKTANVEFDDAGHRPPAGLRAGQHVLLAVADTGLGMTEDVKRRVFEPFFTTKEVGQGTGLGLAVVHGIVTFAGGAVDVSSEPGHGTTFVIYLPTVAGEAEQPASPPRKLAAPLGTESVLLVEDERGVRQLARRVLQAAGYKVLEAANGMDAVRLADTHAGSVDLLITDVVMPGIGGREVAERLLRRNPGMKVLYMSGYTDDAVVRNGVAWDAANFLQKPFTPAALTEKVRDVLDRRPQHHG